jgi:hypothetical protein
MFVKIFIWAPVGAGRVYFSKSLHHHRAVATRSFDMPFPESLEGRHIKRSSDRPLHPWRGFTDREQIVVRQN